MMECCLAGSLNTAGFSSQIKSGILPTSDHITYAGTFNELQFLVGAKTEKNLDLHVGFARANNSSSVKDQNINQFLALFLKGNKDGEPRDDRILNSVIILDISGSMAGFISRNSDETRLSLAKQAIKMFISKLRDTDSFGLVIFNNQGQVVIKGTKKNDVNMEAIFAMVDTIKTSGGTTLSSGFQTGLQVLNGILSNSKNPKGCQNRLIMLTDVNDNSIRTTDDFIKKVSTNNIHTTIIGISEQFRSDICESLTKIKGFNYFCATTTGDLKKYLYENFDWTFFPSSFNIEIKLKSKNVKIFEVFGTPDSKDVNSYNDFAKKGTDSYIITKIPTSFPSELLVEGGIVKTVGGLILVKLSPQNQLQEFKGDIELSYTTSKGEKIVQVYPMEYNFPKNEQFFSEQCLQQAVRGFYFVHEIKSLIDDLNGNQKRFEPEMKKKYIESLRSLKNTAPQSKKPEVDGLIKILQE